MSGGRPQRSEGDIFEEFIKEKLLNYAFNINGQYTYIFHVLKFHNLYKCYVYSICQFGCMSLTLKMLPIAEAQGGLLLFYELPSNLSFHEAK